MSTNTVIIFIAFLFIFSFIFTIITLNIALKLIEDRYIQEKNNVTKMEAEIETLNEEIVFLRNFYRRDNTGIPVGNLNKIQEKYDETLNKIKE